MNDILAFRSVTSSDSNYHDSGWHAATPTKLAVPDISSPSSAVNEGREKRFSELVSEWVKATMNVSSIDAMARHPAYQEIIEMGRPVVPLLLAQLEKDPDFWFVALEKITGENPVSMGDAGNLSRMTDAWLDWGVKNNYL